MRRLYWRLRLWLFPPKPPLYTRRIDIGVPEIFQWSRGMAAITDVGIGYVTACDYARGFIDVGVW